MSTENAGGLQSGQEILPILPIIGGRGHDVFAETEEINSFGLFSMSEGKEIQLAMQSLWLTGQVGSYGARLLVNHVLKSSEPTPVEVVYSFMLPRDSTLRRFKITGDNFTAHSELKPTQQAQQEYEKGIQEGHLSAFSRIYRDGVVNLNVGNIQPNETIKVQLELLAGVEPHRNGFRFRFPFALAPSYHSQAKMIDCGNGQGEINLPEDKFGDVILPVYMKESDNLHQIGFNLDVDFPDEHTQVASPSHNIQVKRLKDSFNNVALALNHDVPNRDLIIDVHSDKPQVKIQKGADETGKTSFIATIPSTEFGASSEEPRSFVFLLDRSGSMGGRPMEQAKNALRACISALSEKDCFSLVAFDNQVEVFDGLVQGTMEVRKRLESFLENIHARGGTELNHGIKTAAAILGKNGGDIMVITDGQVSETESIIQYAKSLSVRVHILGIGSSSQDRFFTSLTRETGGNSKFVTPRERIDLVALELFADIGRPVATNLKVKLIGAKEGKIEPDIATQIYENASIQIFGYFDQKDTPQLLIEWDIEGQHKMKEYSLVFENNSDGNILRWIRGSRLITDYENKRTTFAGQTGSVKREGQRVDEWIAKLSTEYGLSSSQMSLIAVLERQDDRPGVLPKTMVVPVGMPQDVKFDSYFSAKCSRKSIMLDLDITRSACYCMKSEMHLSHDVYSPLSLSDAESPSPTDSLMQLAIKLEPDGGMPGDTLEQRVEDSLSALIVFVKEETTIETGPYRVHVKKLVDFLNKNIRLIQKEEVQTIYKMAIEKLNATPFKNRTTKKYATEKVESLFKI